jgi:hypothetical protein
MPRWQQCVLGPAAVKAAVEVDSKAGQTSADTRRGPEAVVAGAASSRSPTQFHTLNRPGWRHGCASTTTAMMPRPGIATPPARTWETSRPGVTQHRCRLAADPDAGPAHQQVFPLGHRSFLQYPPTQVFSTCHGPQPVWPSGSAHTLLGRAPGAASLPGSGFFL